MGEYDTLIKMVREGKGERRGSFSCCLLPASHKKRCRHSSLSLACCSLYFRIVASSITVACRKDTAMTDPATPDVAAVVTAPIDDDNGNDNGNGSDVDNGNEVAMDDVMPPSPPHGDPPPSLTINNSHVDAPADAVQGVTLTDAAGRSGVYTGPVRASKPHTTLATRVGTMVYDSDTANSENATSTTATNNNIRSYTGGWVDGAWEGPQGTLTTIAGDVYEGPFACQTMAAGMGRYVWADGRVYAGQFAAGGVRQGQGRYEWPSTGAVYQGAFSSNQRHGYGQYTDPSTKITYTGEWEGGLYQGYGQYEYTLGGDTQLVYRGNFVRGQPHGQGTEVVVADGRIRYEGEWIKGKPVKASKKATSSHHTASRAVMGAVAAPPVAPPAPRVIQVVSDHPWVDVHHDNQVATYRGLWNTQLDVPCKNGTAEYATDTEMLRYEGCFSEAGGQFHGKGRLVWRNGDVYEGDFAQGHRQGSGVYRWADGRQYTGDFVLNVREGQGRLLYANGDFYEGGFYQGQRHGPGRFIFRNGSMYEGGWLEGRYHGRGTLVQADGRTYVGDFVKGKSHGVGQEMDPSGNMVYDGEFVKGRRLGEFVADDDTDDDDEEEEEEGEKAKGGTGTAAPKKPSEPACEAVVDEEITDCQGNLGRYTGIVRKESRRPHGVGRLVYADGRRIHEGFWTDGSKEGHGRCLFFPQGDFHEGEYTNNLRNGPGRYKWKDGRSFVGGYTDDLRHGKGVFKYPSGDCYEGMFAKGQRSGFGRFNFDGGYYEGDWALGKYNGTGVLHWGQGHSYQGEFIEGTFHGKGVKKNGAGEIIQEGYWGEGHFQGPDEKKEEEEDGGVQADPPASAPPPPPTSEETAEATEDILSTETTPVDEVAPNSPKGAPPVSDPPPPPRETPVATTEEEEAVSDQPMTLD